MKKRIFYLFIFLVLPVLTNANQKSYFSYVNTLFHEIPFEEADQPLISLANNLDATTNKATLLNILRKGINVVDDTPPKAASESCRSYSSSLLITKAFIIHNQMVLECLFSSLNLIQKAIAYWEDRQNHYLSYLVERGPYQWLYGKSQNEDLQEKLSSLNTIKNQLVHRIGKIKSTANSLKKEANIFLLEEMILDSLRETHAFLHHKAIPEALSQPVEKSDSKAFFQLLIDNLQHLSSYQTIIHQKLSAHDIPWHIRRNWLYYTAATVASLIGGSFLYDHKDEIPQWFDSVKNSTQHTYKLAVGDRVKNLATIVGQWNQEGIQHQNQEENDGESILPICNNEAIEELEDLPDVTLADFRQERDRLEAMLQASSHFETMEEVNRTYEALSNNPTNSILSSFTNLFARMTIRNEVPAAISIKGQKILVDVYRTLAYINHEINRYGDTANEFIPVLREALNNILPMVNELQPQIVELVQKTEHISNAVQIPAELMGMVPALIFAYGMYQGGKFFYKKAAAQEQFAEQIKVILKEITKIISEYYQNDGKFSLEDLGLLEFWFYQLQSYATYLPEKIKAVFLFDIEIITSENLSLEQKLERISDLYNKYSFLRL